ncbi:hypothetical protein V6N13_118309 [Hibiscus sabdariffa]
MHNDDSYTIEVETNRHIGVRRMRYKRLWNQGEVSDSLGLKDGIGPIDVVNDDKKDKLIGFTDDEEKGLCGELNAMSFRASEDMHCMGLYTLDDLRGSTEPVKSIKKKSAWEAGVDGKHCSQGAGLEDP